VLDVVEEHPDGLEVAAVAKLLGVSQHRVTAAEIQGGQKMLKRLPRYPGNQGDE
jgi:predicted transcriptional regulator